MEASEVADMVRDAAEEARARERAEAVFNTRAAITIAVMAMLLAITSLGGENAAKEMVNSNILASDTWAFYQAKNIRQTSYRLAADELELLLPVLPPEQRAEAVKKIESYRATANRYESEPDPNDPDNPLKGEGKRELMARGRYWEARRDHAQAQDPNFDYASALYQIAIVLGSVSIVARRPAVLYLGVALAALATVLMVNGFTLMFELPI